MAFAFDDPVEAGWVTRLARPGVRPARALGLTIPPSLLLRADHASHCSVTVYVAGRTSFDVLTALGVLRTLLSVPTRTTLATRWVTRAASRRGHCERRTVRVAGMQSLNTPDLTGLTLLVVDDNDDSLDMLATFLIGCGASVLQARDGVAAVRHIDTAPKLDALITDLAMPLMDGVELVQTLRRHPAHHALPAIAVSGFFEDYVDVGGFDAFLRKPINLDELTQRISAVIDARRG